MNDDTNDTNLLPSDGGVPPTTTGGTSTGTGGGGTTITPIPTGPTPPKIAEDDPPVEALAEVSP